MNSPIATPQFRVECRAKDAPEEVSWSIVEMAWTAKQAERQKAQLLKQFPGGELEVRIAENKIATAPASVVETPRPAPTPAPAAAPVLAPEPPKPEPPKPNVLPFGRGAILRDINTSEKVRVTETFHFHPRNIAFTWETLPRIKDGVPGPTQKGGCPVTAVGYYELIEDGEPPLALPAEETPPPALVRASDPLDAITGETPLPYGVGATLRDVHTGTTIEVTEVFRSNRRFAFAWKTADGSTGKCPIASLGCFELISTPATATAGESGAPGAAAADATDQQPPTSSAAPAATDQGAAPAPAPLETAAAPVTKAHASKTKAAKAKKPAAKKSPKAKAPAKAKASAKTHRK